MKPSYALWGFLVVSQSVHAATLNWDANAAAAPVAVDGGGTWTASPTPPLNFHDGTANVAWPSGAGVTDIAVFGNISSTPIGIPGAIDWAAGITVGVGGLVFNPYYGNVTKYNIRGNTATSVITFNGTPTVAVETNPARPFAAINAPIAGTVGFDVTSTTGGIFEIGTQFPGTITGNIRLKAGSSLSIGNDAALGGASNGFSFDGTSTFITRGNTALAATRTFTINNGSLAKFDSINGATLTVNSAIVEAAGTGQLQKEGLGGLTLNVANTYTGNTGIRQGTLTLNFADAAAPVSNLINSSSGLRLLGGTLAVTGKASTANTQSFSGLTMLPGASGLTSTPGATGGTTNLSLGGISRIGGSTLNLATIAAGTSYSTNTPDTNGILGGFATVNNADWVTAAGGTLAANTIYQTGTDATAWAATDNVSLAGTPTVPLAGSATVNSLKYTATGDVAIPAGQTLTLSSGGVLVTAGNASITGGNLAAGVGANEILVHQHSAAGTATISSVIDNNGSPVSVTKTGSGTLVLGGTNLYSNNSFLTGGTLEISSDANLGIGSVLTSRPGTTLRIAGSTAFSSGKTFNFDFGSNSYGATALGGSATDVGNFNVVVSNTAGATISGAFNVTGGTLVKSGAGALTLTHAGPNMLARLNGGMGLIVQEGGITFNGGAGSEWRVGQAEFVVGAGTDATKASAKEATVTVQSGTVVVGSWTGVARGNGTVNHQSKIVMTGGTWDTGNLSLGFANSVGSYAARPTLDLSGNASFIVRDDALMSESGGSAATINVADNAVFAVRDEFRAGLTGNASATLNFSGNSVTSSGGSMRFGQGGTATANLSGSAQLLGGSFMNIGNSGTGTVNVSDNAVFTVATDFNIGDTDNSIGTLNVSGGTVNASLLAIGKGGNAAGSPTTPTRGVVNQTGGIVQQFGAGNTSDWRIGGFAGANDSEVYGSYTISGGSLNTGNRNFQIGTYGIGVMDVRGGTVDTNNGGGFPVIARRPGSFGLLDVSSGSFKVNNTAQLLLVAEEGSASLNISGTGSVLVSSNPAGAGNGGGTGGVRVAHGAGASGTVSLNGGTLETSGIAKSSTALTSSGSAYLNGGLLKARATNPTFMQGLNQAIVGPGGAMIDNNGQSITIGQSLLASAAATGVTSIPVASGGAGYIGAPVVAITGGAGIGATAVANLTGGAVTSITITSPGGGFLGVPTVTLLGGGATTPATIGTATIGAGLADGGLTQSGFGTLTLGGTNTYTGTTAVIGDTLLVTGSLASPVTVAANCSIGGTGTINNSLTVDATGILSPGLAGNAGTLTAGNTVMPGTYLVDLDGANADRITVTGNLDISGAILSVASLPGGATQPSYTIASYTGTLAGSFVLSGSLPATYTLVNDTGAKEIKLVSGGNYGIWQAGFGLTLGTTGAPEGDADLDGIDNAVEYVTGGNPTVSSQAPSPLATFTATDVIFTFSRPDSSETPDVSTVLEVGTTLDLWPVTYNIGATTATSSPGVTVTENGTDPDTIAITVPKGVDTTKFARLVVTIAN